MLTEFRAVLDRLDFRVTDASPESAKSDSYTKNILISVRHAGILYGSVEYNLAVIDRV